MRVIILTLRAGKRPGDLFHPGKQWWFHFRDFNVCKDTSASSTVLYSGVPIVLTPFELATKITINRSDLEMMRQGDDASKWLAKASESWLSFWENELKSSYFLSSIKHPEIIEGFNQFLANQKKQIDALKRKYKVDIID